MIEWGLNSTQKKKKNVKSTFLLTIFGPLFVGHFIRFLSFQDFLLGVFTRKGSFLFDFISRLHVMAFTFGYLEVKYI